ncbi:MAG: glycosyltransferase [Planctomycetota bacterium]|jgi:UDP:flavonoid glycosyltransferase YjiC (YdhE family)
MRALLTTVGTLGDVNPFLAVGMELSRRGHEATVLTEPRYRSLVQDAGLAFRSLLPEHDGADDLLEVVGGAGGLDGSRRVFAALRRDAPAALLAAERAIDDLRPQLVLCHHLCVTAGWAATAAEIPWGVAALAPASWPSLEQPVVYPGMPDRDHYARSVLRAGHRLGRFVVSVQVDPGLNRLRRERGLPPRRHHLFEPAFAGSFNLGLWSPSYRAPASDDPARSTICGFTWLDDVTQRFPEPIAEFVERGPAPLIFCLGTSASRAGRRFYAAARDACRRLGRRGVLLTGDAPEPATIESDALCIARAASHARLMPSVDAVVHHGGMGTTAQVLRAGRPMVVVPHAHDQFDNASRCRRLGVSRTLSWSRVSGARLARVLSTVTEDPAFGAAAGRLATSLAEEDGARAAVDVLERHAGSLAIA